MRKPKPKFTWEHLDALRADVGLVEDDDPDSFTEADYAARYDIPRSTARDQIQALVRKGVLQAGRKRIRTGHGVRNVNCYWPNV